MVATVVDCTRNWRYEPMTPLVDKIDLSGLAGILAIGVLLLMCGPLP
jgi:hypothetical protein